MNKTQRFREIAAKYQPHNYIGDDDDWYEIEPGVPVNIDGHVIIVLESTNFNIPSKIVAPDTYEEYVLVNFEGELYRLSGQYNSWSGTEWGQWQRVVRRPVTVYEYEEVDNG